MSWYEFECKKSQNNSKYEDNFQKKNEYCQHHLHFGLQALKFILHLSYNSKGKSLPYKFSLRIAGHGSFSRKSSRQERLFLAFKSVKKRILMPILSIKALASLFRI